MSEILQFHVGLEGWVGGPGVNTWYAAPDDIFSGDAATWATALYNVYDVGRTWLAPGVTAVIDSVARRFNAQTGELIGVEALPALPPLGSSAAASDGVMGRAEQIWCRFVTNTIRNNRVLSGGVFFGPVSAYAVGQDGQLKAEVKSGMEGLLGELLQPYGDLRHNVWGQPSDANPVGVAGDVVSYQVSSTPGTLRSRKR